MASVPWMHDALPTAVPPGSQGSLVSLTQRLVPLMSLQQWAGPQSQASLQVYVLDSAHIEILPALSTHLWPGGQVSVPLLFFLLQW